MNGSDWLTCAAFCLVAVMRPSGRNIPPIQNFNAFICSIFIFKYVHIHSHTYMHTYIEPWKPLLTPSVTYSARRGTCPWHCHGRPSLRSRYSGPCEKTRCKEPSSTEDVRTTTYHQVQSLHSSTGYHRPYITTPNKNNTTTK